MYNLLPGQYESRTGDLTESVRDAPRPAPRPPFFKRWYPPFIFHFNYARSLSASPTSSMPSQWLGLVNLSSFSGPQALAPDPQLMMFRMMMPDDNWSWSLKHGLGLWLQFHYTGCVNDNRCVTTKELAQRCKNKSIINGCCSIYQQTAVEETRMGKAWLQTDRGLMRLPSARGNFHQD